jgi:hypothetical protein
MGNVPHYVRKPSFGSPPLLQGEDAEAYNDLLAQLLSSLQPLDVLGEVLVREIADITWDIRRYRRAKTTLIADWLVHVLEKELGVENLELLSEFAIGEPAAIAKVEALMAKYKLTINMATDRALVDAMEAIQNINRQFELAEARRNVLLRELDRRCSVLTGKAESMSEQTVAYAGGTA